MQKVDELWELLRGFYNVFAWIKGELGCHLIGKYSIDMQCFFPCHIIPNHLSKIGKKGRLKKQIEAMMQIGRMCANHLEYAYKVTLPTKWNGPKRFCGYYRPLNQQTRHDSYTPFALNRGCFSIVGKIHNMICILASSRSKWF